MGDKRSLGSAGLWTARVQASAVEQSPIEAASSLPGVLGLTGEGIDLLVWESDIPLMSHEAFDRRVVDPRIQFMKTPPATTRPVSLVL